jgi:hypothetical protein
MHLLREFNKKYLIHVDYGPTTASLGNSFYDCYLLLSAISNDDTCATGSAPHQLPMPCKLLCLSFRHLISNPNLSFNQEACFKITHVFVLKSRYFEPMDILALHRCHPLLSHLLCACIHLHDHNFLWLAEYNMCWAMQESLSDDKLHAFLICLLH